MRTTIPLLALCALLRAADPAPVSAGSPAPPRIVEVAICLDTSGSMSGLIDAARRKLWAIVNDLALAKPAPRLRVALLTFGNDGHDAEQGWVKVDSELTEDLDRISEILFALGTNGGTELVGRVVDRATRLLAWTPDAMKVIFVAGNESADQDLAVPFRVACKGAIEKGILVNSIYCGDPADELAPGWQEVARLADGHYMAIDQDDGTVTIATPFDETIAALSASLNTTYIPIGAEGLRAAENQVMQDANAEKSGVAAERGCCKASGLYVCGWDLVDAVRDGRKLEEVKPEELPEALRKLDGAGLRRHVEEMAAKRDGIRREMQTAQEKRAEFLAKEQAKNAALGEKAFDRAVRDAVRAQACRAGFRFEAEAPAPAPAEAPAKN